MKWEPDWSDIADNLLIGLMVLAVRKPTGMDPLYDMTDSEFYKRFVSL